MSDHHGHHHDHGGNEPPWLNRLKFVVTGALMVLMFVIILLDKLHLLPNKH